MIDLVIALCCYVAWVWVEAEFHARKRNKELALRWKQLNRENDHE